jgi:hypothetical protein
MDMKPPQGHDISDCASGSSRFLRAKKEKQHKPANIKRQALLKIAAHEAQDQAE